MACTEGGGGLCVGESVGCPAIDNRDIFPRHFSLNVGLTDTYLIYHFKLTDQFVAPGTLSFTICQSVGLPSEAYNETSR